MVVEFDVSRLPILIGHDAQNLEPVCIRLKLAGCLIDVIKLVKSANHTPKLSAFQLARELNHGARRLAGTHLDILQIHIAVGAAHPHHLDALHFDALDQALVIGIERVEFVHGVVPIFMRGGIVEREQRLEALHGLTRGAALLAHLLRFIDDENGVRSRNHIDRAAAAEFIALGKHNERLFALAALFQRPVKRLHVDDHDGNIRTAGKRVYLCQTA